MERERHQKRRTEVEGYQRRCCIPFLTKSRASSSCRRRYLNSKHWGCGEVRKANFVVVEYGHDGGKCSKDQWRAAHRMRATGVMSSSCKVRRTEAQSFDRTVRQTPRLRLHQVQDIHPPWGPSPSPCDSNPSPDPSDMPYETTETSAGFP
jgi:hypothetical protein